MIEGGDAGASRAVYASSWSVRRRGYGLSRVSECSFRRQRGCSEAACTQLVLEGVVERGDDRWWRELRVAQQQVAKHRGETSSGRTRRQPQLLRAANCERLQTEPTLPPCRTNLAQPRLNRPLNA